MNAALTLLPEFALILLGLRLRHDLQLGAHFWSGLEKLIYFVLFPALLFSALVKTQIAWQAAAPLLATGLAATLAAMALGLLMRWLFAFTPMSFASQFQCAFRYNSYLGLAIAGSLHGAGGIAAMGLLTGALVPVVNAAAVWMLARHGKLGLMRELAKNPLVLATLAGLLCSTLGIHPPEVLQHLLDRLAAAAIALGLLAVGAALRLRGGIESGGHGGRLAAAWILAVKLLVMPAVAVLTARALGVSGIYYDSALTFAALPIASSAYILAQRMGGDGQRVAWLISASTLLAMLTLPLWLALLG